MDLTKKGEKRRRRRKKKKQGCERARKRGSTTREPPERYIQGEATMKETRRKFSPTWSGGYLTYIVKDLQRKD
jgi:hypothetical protein